MLMSGVWLLQTARAVAITSGGQLLFERPVEIRCVDVDRVVRVGHAVLGGSGPHAQQLIVTDDGSVRLSYGFTDGVALAEAIQARNPAVRVELCPADRCRTGRGRGSATRNQVPTRAHGGTNLV